MDIKNGFVVDEVIFAHLTLTREIELARKGKPHDPALVRISRSRRSSTMAEIIFHSAIACKETGRDAVLRAESAGGEHQQHPGDRERKRAYRADTERPVVLADTPAPTRQVIELQAHGEEQDADARLEARQDCDPRSDAQTAHRDFCLPEISHPVSARVSATCQAAEPVRIV